MVKEYADQIEDTLRIFVVFVKHTYILFNYWISTNTTKYMYLAMWV